MVRRIIIGIFLASLLAALPTMIMGYESQAKYIAAPALLLSGWAAVGHLITLDDDASGGWSNPKGAKSIWRSSMVELSLKVIVFVVVGIMFYA
ncbi:hypothetical protein [Isoalcanivorax indicus]|uniref:hypothetical protein n=1 Tax=Isoalcanivorax indicus TaxID=2202653 RepID=UPI0013C47021|nr:hypothetical protein [Isoalcanivorax indicus]